MHMSIIKLPSLASQFDEKETTAPMTYQTKKHQTRNSSNFVSHLPISYVLSPILLNPQVISNSRRRPIVLSLLFRPLQYAKDWAGCALVKLQAHPTGCTALMSKIHDDDSPQRKQSRNARILKKKMSSRRHWRVHYVILLVEIPYAIRVVYFLCV